MNRIQVDGMAAILGVTFRPHVAGQSCYNYHRDYHCRNKATEDAVKRDGQNTITIRTCSNAYCRIAAAINVYDLSQPPTDAARERMEDAVAQAAIRSRADRSLAIHEAHLSRKFGRPLSLRARP